MLTFRFWKEKPCRRPHRLTTEDPGRKNCLRLQEFRSVSKITSVQEDLSQPVLPECWKTLCRLMMRTSLKNWMKPVPLCLGNSIWMSLQWALRPKTAIFRLPVIRVTCPVYRVVRPAVQQRQLRRMKRSLHSEAIPAVLSVSRRHSAALSG